MVESSESVTETKSVATPLRPKRILLWIARAIEKLSLSAVIAASLGPLLRVDRITVGMLLTYSPRVVWLLLALILACFYIVQRRRWRLLLIITASMLLGYDTGAGSWVAMRQGMSKGNQLATGNHLADESQTLTLLSFNTHYAAADEVASLCRKHQVDIVSLQEHRPTVGSRLKILRALPAYELFSADLNAPVKRDSRHAFSCLSGVRRSLLSATSETEIHTAITEYRTFAGRLNLKSGPLWIVNVHTCKPLKVTLNPKSIVRNAAAIANRHRDEAELLSSWLTGHVNSQPTLIAGDFNAPANVHNLRIEGFASAHQKTGNGLHLTFPSGLPIIGIDHVLGNAPIVFHSCEILDTGLSDHNAMLVRFSIRAGR